MTTNYLDCNTVFYERACDLFGDMRQQQVADITGLAQGKISDILTYRVFPERYQNKKPSAEMVCKIARAFNVSTDYLLGLTDYKTNEKATRELCSTLGLSEEAIKILSVDPTSLAAIQSKKALSKIPFEDIVARSEDPQKIRDYQKFREDQLVISLNRMSSTISHVFNNLIDDYNNAHSLQNADNFGEPAIVELLKNYYETLDASEIQMHVDRKCVDIPHGAYFSSVNKEGENRIYFESIKEFMIDSYINKISARLNSIKNSELFKHVEYKINLEENERSNKYET